MTILKTQNFKNLKVYSNFGILEANLADSEFLKDLADLKAKFERMAIYYNFSNWKYFNDAIYQLKFNY